MLKAGFAKQEITPKTGVPLGGYFTLKGRNADAVRDQLFARAAAFQSDDRLCILLSLDLLMISEQMHRKIARSLSDLNAQVMVCATHTHSGPGGFWNGLVPKLALGRFVPGMLESLCAQAEKAARAAVADLREAKYSVYTDHLPELAKNRRDENGPTDDGLFVLRINRAKAKKGNALIVGFPGHPVIVAERDFNKISGDFPGEVVRRLEDGEAEFALFVNGALGGVDVRFPDEPISVEENFELQAGPIVEAAKNAKKGGLKTKGALLFAAREIRETARPDVQAAFDDQPILKHALWPLNKLVSWAFARDLSEHWRVQAIALGDMVLIGAPADLGVGVSLALQAYAHGKGFAHPFVISQCDGYLGYLHRRADYARLPAKGTRGMAIYENVMGVFGREMGERYLAEAKGVIDELARQ